MKKIIALLLALVMVMGLVACGGNNAGNTESPNPDTSENPGTSETPETPETPAEKVLTIGLTSDVTPLDCVNPTTETAAWINNIMYPTLVAAAQDENGNLKVVYQLMESIEASEDNKTFTIKIRSDVKWSDGEPVKASDVVFAIDLFTDPVVGSTSMATFLTMLDGIVDARKGYRAEGAELTSAEAVDETTLVIHTSGEYDVDFIETRLCYNLYALPEHVLGDVDRASLLGSSEAIESDVVYGAFYVYDFTTASELILAANESYFLGAPKLDYIRFVFTTASSIATSLASGDIDMAWPGSLDAADYAYVAGLSNVETTVGAPNSLTALFINNEVVPDARVREAISLAINRQAIVDGVLGGYGEISNLPVSSVSPYYCEQYATPAFDVEAAKALIEEAGWTGKTLKLSIGSGKVTTQNIAALVQNNLNAIGLNVEIEVVDNAVLNCIMGQYEITFITQTEQPLTPSHTLGILVNTGSWCKYETQEAADLYAKLTAPTTPDELMSVMERLQEIVATEYPVVPLYNATSLLAKTNNMTVGGPASFGMLVNIHEWDVAG